jgi:hypothetical protein
MTGSPLFVEDSAGAVLKGSGLLLGCFPLSTLGSGMGVFPVKESVVSSQLPLYCVLGFGLGQAQGFSLPLRARPSQGVTPFHKMVHFHEPFLPQALAFALSQVPLPVLQGIHFPVRGINFVFPLDHLQARLYESVAMATVLLWFFFF